MSPRSNPSSSKRRPTGSRRQPRPCPHRRPLRLELLEDRRLLALVTVTTALDTVDFNDGVTSLREAIFATNTVPGADTIRFEFGHDANEDGPATILLTQGELRITDALTIDGPGADLLTIDAGCAPYIFSIDSHAFDSTISVSIQDLALNGGTVLARHGSLSIVDCVVTDGSLSAFDCDVTVIRSRIEGSEFAGVEASGGRLTVLGSLISRHVIGVWGNATIVSVIDSTVSENSFSGISVVNNDAGTSPVGPLALNVINSLIANNGLNSNPELFVSGGGITSNRVDVAVTNTKIFNNVSSGANSGGIAVLDGQLTVANSLLSGNRSDSAGAIFFQGGQLRLNNSTISDSGTLNNRGIAAVYFKGTSNDSHLEMINTTISGNSFARPALQISGGTAAIRHSTIVQNGNPTSGFGGRIRVRSGELLLDHSIVAASVSGSGTDFRNDVRVEAGAVLQARHSLIGNNRETNLEESPSGVPDADGNLIGGLINGIINPMLGPLADNGGFTLPDGSHILTHALLPGSPAINMGDLNAVAGVDGIPEFDQRGEPFGRIVGGRIDIGAYEYQEPSDLNLLVDTLVDESDGDYSRGDLSLREAIELANATRFAGVVDTIRFDPALHAAGPATILLTMGELAITDDLLIKGPGASMLTIDGGVANSVFSVDDGRSNNLIDVEICGVALGEGKISVVENLSLCEVYLQFVRGDGGSLSIIDCVVNGRDFAGGILGTNTNITVVRTRIEEVSIGIDLTNGSLAVVDCTIQENGAGIQAFVRATNSVSVSGSDISRNVSHGIFVSQSEPLGSEPTDEVQLNISHSTISNNGRRVSDSFNDLGGVFATHVRVSVSNSVISGNSANGLGFAFGAGGITVRYGDLSVDGSVISDNQGSLAIVRSAGGISLRKGNLEIADSVLSGNRGMRGGAVYVREGGQSMLKNSSFSGIESNSGGPPSYSYFGVVAFRPSTRSNVEVENCTISGSVETVGINLGNSKAVIRHTTISAGGAGTSRPRINMGGASSLELVHSIVSGSQQLDSVDIGIQGMADLSARHSLISNGRLSGLAESPISTPDASGNIVGGPIHGFIDPLLGPLADNGGFTLPDGSHILTHALLPGSPAINMGDLNAVAGVAGVPEFDQRGEPFGRIIDGRIDIGAFERQELDLLVDTLVDESDGDYSRGDLSLREAIELANATKFAGVVDTIRFDPALHAAGPATILLTMGELRITDDVAIVGLGAEQLTIDAEGKSHIFQAEDHQFLASMNVEISGLTLTGGNPHGNQYGGAIHNRENLTLSECTVIANLGESIFNEGGSLTVVDCLVTDNSYSGIYSTSGVVTVIDSQITANAGTGIAVGNGDDISGSLNVVDSVISDNDTGIFSTGVTVSVSGSTIAGNLYGGIYVSGRIRIHPVDEAIPVSLNNFYPAPLTVSNSTIANNAVLESSTYRDGGIYATGVKVTVSGSIIVGNVGNNFAAGGITVLSGELEVSESLLVNNCGQAGAVLVNDSKSLLINSTVTGNDGLGFARTAILFDGSRNGDHLEIVNSTIADNAPGTSGLQFWGGTAAIRHSTIAHNGSATNGRGRGIELRGGELLLDHSIVAGFPSGSGVGLGFDVQVSPGAILKADYSLIGNNNMSGLAETPGGIPDASGSLIGGAAHGFIDPLLGPLADNGGFTLPDGSHILTHALLPGSPAINAGDPSAVADVDGVPIDDQRGTPFTRVYGGRIDIGAVEYLPAGVLPGDYDEDGTVNLADYSLWRNAMGTNSPPGTGADGNGDGKVDKQDYQVWKHNFGATIDDLSHAPFSVNEGLSLATDSDPELSLSQNGSAQPPLQYETTAEVRRSFRSQRSVPRQNFAAVKAIDAGLLAWSFDLRDGRREAKLVDSQFTRRVSKEDLPAAETHDLAFATLGSRSPRNFDRL